MCQTMLFQTGHKLHGIGKEGERYSTEKLDKVSVGEKGEARRRGKGWGTWKIDRRKKIRRQDRVTDDMEEREIKSRDMEERE